jgi:transposase InsO family protein
MMHVDTKRLPLLAGETPHATREYLCVGIDDFSRELYAAILPDKTQYSAAAFCDQVLEECPYTIEPVYSDNGLEYRGNPDDHAFMQLCKAHQMNQRFTKVRNPKTNGKAERVIKTLIELWHEQTVFNSRAHRKQELTRFVNWYNTVKPHASLNIRCRLRDSSITFIRPNCKQRLKKSQIIFDNYRTRQSSPPPRCPCNAARCANGL